MYDFVKFLRRGSTVFDIDKSNRQNHWMFMFKKNELKTKIMKRILMNEALKGENI